VRVLYPVAFEQLLQIAIRLIEITWHDGNFPNEWQADVYSHNKLKIGSSGQELP